MKDALYIVVVIAFVAPFEAKLVEDADVEWVQSSVGSVRVARVHL